MGYRAKSALSVAVATEGQLVQIVSIEIRQTLLFQKSFWRNRLKKKGKGIGTLVIFFLS